MKSVLVTGAAGFVGANLVRRCVAEGHAVHAVVRPGGDRWRLDSDCGAAIHEVDVRDADAVLQVTRLVRPQWVFHCAAYGAYSWQRDAGMMRETNVTSTANLLTACRRSGFEAFVNTGSSSEYGYQSRAAAESDRAQPNSPYAATKLQATRACIEDARRHGGSVTTLRLYSVYGPYEEPNRLMPTLLTAALRGMLPPLVHPDTARDFVYVDDVCDAYLCVAAQPPGGPGAIFNVGSGTQTTIADVVALVRSMFHVTAEPQWGSMAARSWDTNVWCADIRKIARQVGWTPRHSLHGGLSRFRDWLEDHPLARERYDAALSTRLAG